MHTEFMNAPNCADHQSKFTFILSFAEGMHMSTVGAVWAVILASLELQTESAEEIQPEFGSEPVPIQN